MRRLGPPLLHVLALEGGDEAARVADGEGLLRDLLDDTDLADEAGGRATRGEATLEVDLVRLAHLEDGAELLAEEGIEDVCRRSGLGNAVEGDIGAAAASEHHLGDCRHQTAVRDVVVGEDDTALMELLQGIEQVRDQVHVTDVRRLVSELAECLGEGGTAHGLLARGKVDVQEDRLADVLNAAKLGRPGSPDIVHD